MGNPNDQRSATRLAARGTIISVLLRIVSFGCTQWTFRMLDPSTLGKASIPLELLLTTVLFLSREGFRLALTRNIVDNSHYRQQQDNIWNVAWLTIPVTAVTSLLAMFWHVFTLTHHSLENGPGEPMIDRDYLYAGLLYCLAAFLEGCAEPAVLYSLRQMNVALKASAEGLATVAKTVMTVIGLQVLRSTWPVTAFGWAQVTYSVVYLIFLYGATWRYLVPPRWSREAWDRHSLYLTLIFTVQGFFKHLLTEGDRIVLTTLSQSYDQGVYAMGSAYGGLAARIILQPLEENGRLLWSRQASSSSSTSQGPTDGTMTLEKDPLYQSYTVLVKLVLYVGLIFSSLAVNYTSILLTVLAGRRWGDHGQAAAVLSAFCVYTAFLAWNGTTEAFVYAVAATGADMGRLGVAHTLIGVLFAVLAGAAVTTYGTVGLVAANCVAMFLRTLYSVTYASHYFAERHQRPFSRTLIRILYDMFPHRLVLLAFSASYWASLTSWKQFAARLEEFKIVSGSTQWYSSAAQHVAVGASLGVGLLSMAVFLEHDLRQSARSMLRAKQD